MNRRPPRSTPASTASGCSRSTSRHIRGRNRTPFQGTGQGRESGIGKFMPRPDFGSSCFARHHGTTARVAARRRHCACAKPPARPMLADIAGERIMGAHESMEHAEHAEHASSENRKIALLIAVIALFLAFSETLGKGAQTEALGKNVEASNLWAFFQD